MIVEMPTRSNISMCIPCDSVCGSLVYSQVAVRADPGFAIVGVCTCRALHNIVDTVFSNGSSNADTNCV
ncbi:MAG: hypothetical protein RL319_708 [Actinomycetota bacterium]